MNEIEIENWVSEITLADPLEMGGVDPEFEAWWNEVVEAVTADNPLYELEDI